MRFGTHAPNIFAMGLKKGPRLYLKNSVKNKPILGLFDLSGCAIPLRPL